MTTQSRFTNSYLCHHGRCGTKTKTRRPHRRSQSAICAITVDPTQKQLLDDPFEVHNRLCVPSRSIRHKYNDLTTQSRFANSYVCHHGRCGTKTTTRRRHRGSQSAICVTTVDAAQKQRLDDPIEVHNRRAAAMIDAAQKQRLDDPIAVHNRCAAITVDATQKQRLDNPLEVHKSARCRHGRRGTKTTTRRPHRGSQSVCCRHGRCGTKPRLDDPIELQNRLSVVTADPAQQRTTDDPIDVHDRLFVPSLSMRHKNKKKRLFVPSRSVRHKNKKRPPHRVSQRRAAVMVHPAQKQLPDDPIDVHNRLFVPSRSIQHKNNDSTTHARFTNSYSCHHSQCGTNTTTRRPRSQSAICVITVDPAQIQRLDDPSRFTIVYVCHHGRSGTNTMT